MLIFQNINIPRSPSKKEYFFKLYQGFPGGSVVKNSPASAGDTGAIPDPERAHIPRSNSAHVPQTLSLCSGAQEPQLLKPTRPEPTLHEKPLQWEARTAAREQPAQHSRENEDKKINTVWESPITYQVAAVQEPGSGSDA